MALYNVSPHHSLVSEYQQSAIPWIQELASASNTKVDFPFVTRWIIVSAQGGAVSLAFSSGGIAASQYIIIPNTTMSPRIEVKCKSIWITGAGALQVMAGLTNVKHNDFPDITGLPGIVGA
jgi:hypothetical protein